ncbi:MAG: hypothetical protein ACFE0O_00685 [Opitutales bacterium]
MRWTRKSRRLGCVIGLAAVSLGLSADEVRTFTAPDGRTLEGTVLGFPSERSVEIRRSDGQVFVLPFDQLAQQDQIWLEAARAEAISGPDGPTLNEALGQPVFGQDLNLWQEPVDAVARRLGWPRESKTSRLSSFRTYPRSRKTLLGARFHTAALYGEDGRPERLSLVFANKGDSVHELKGARDLEQKLQEAIDRDATLLESRLTELLGQPSRQSLGEGRGTRLRALRWDAGPTAFLLAAEDLEYVGLQIMPSPLADEGGLKRRLSDNDIRNRAMANIEERPNGDVVVGNIPMVNQGPKGYCVPATMERYLRYLGMSADMYLLALAGQTNLGGGTYLTPLIEGVRYRLQRNNRDFDVVEAPLSIRLLDDYLDDGLPVMWSLHSTPTFNRLTKQRTRHRKRVTDWDTWEKQLRESRRAADDLPPHHGQNRHMAMIIGYNPDTGEIAFSDSWGPDYQERWITEEEAARFSQDRFYVIDF